MNDLESEIVRLTKEWYELIGPDHHKDRDCHFSIVKKWSYGEKQTYHVEHNGYICDDVYSDYFGTYQEAATWLIDKLKSMIESYKTYIHD